MALRIENYVTGFHFDCLPQQCMTLSNTNSSEYTKLVKQLNRILICNALSNSLK